MTDTFSVEWTCDMQGYEFPTVRLGDINWTAWHSVGTHTSWVDGFLHTPQGERIRSLDIVALGCDDKCFEFDDLDLPLMRSLAQEAWVNGSVLLREVNGVGVLYTPLDSLQDQALGQVLARFKP